MPKVTLTYNLPEEQYEYGCSMHGSDWKDIVYEVSMFLRTKLKYGHEYKSIDAALEATRDLLWDACKERSLDPWSE